MPAPPIVEMQDISISFPGVKALDRVSFRLLPGEVRPHPTPFKYVMIAVVLVIITAVEIAVSYLEGSIPDSLIIVLLMIMMIVKFGAVASWYMHLRTDKPIFQRFFILGVTAPIVLYAVVLASLHAFN